AKRIILGIGGSATNDGGIGCAQACGLPVILRDEGAADPREPLVGADLRRVVLIKHARGSPLDRVRITVACDVTNPLFGPNGAARVFGPQKGATAEQVEELDELLRRLAERCGKIAEATTPGAGAAGGLGFAMLAFFGATLRPGFDIVADAVRLRERLRGADLCITGDGRLDAASFAGKAAVSVAVALALIALALSSRRGDGVLSVARNGNYRELRSDRSHVSFTNISGWGSDQPAKRGRVSRPGLEYDNAQPPTMLLLDKTVI